MPAAKLDTGSRGGSWRQLTMAQKPIPVVSEFKGHFSPRNLARETCNNGKNIYVCMWVGARMLPAAVPRSAIFALNSTFAAQACL